MLATSTFKTKFFRRGRRHLICIRYCKIDCHFSHGPLMFFASCHFIQYSFSYSITSLHSDKRYVLYKTIFRNAHFGELVTALQHTRDLEKCRLKKLRGKHICALLRMYTCFQIFEQSDALVMVYWQVHCFLPLVLVMICQEINRLYIKELWDFNSAFYSIQDSTIIFVLEEMIVSLIKFEEKIARRAVTENVFRLGWTWKVMSKESPVYLRNL